MIQTILLTLLTILLAALTAFVAAVAVQYYRDKKTPLYYAKEIADAEECRECGHDFNEHLLVSRTGDPMDGGEMLCPVDDCECRSTWSVDFGKVSS